MKLKQEVKDNKNTSSHSLLWENKQATSTTTTTGNLQSIPKGNVCLWTKAQTPQNHTSASFMIWSQPQSCLIISLPSSLYLLPKYPVLSENQTIILKPAVCFQASMKLLAFPKAPFLHFPSGEYPLSSDETFIFILHLSLNTFTFTIKHFSDKLVII